MATPSEARRRADATAWIDAIDRLELITLAAAWERRA
jgi:hypothetical protein